MKNEPLFRQLFDSESSTYTYLLADERTREALIIDPVVEQADRDLALLKDLNLKLVLILDTHVHADHITGAHTLREETGAKIVVGKNSGAQGADIYIGDGEELAAGSVILKAIATPGHTKGCVSYSRPGMVFTGDALMIKDVGRTDFQGGSADHLYRSITEKLFSLPNDTIIYPAHDYSGRQASSVAEEKAENKKLGSGASLAEFKEKVSATKLSQPKKIDIAVPANLRCGKPGL